MSAQGDAQLESGTTVVVPNLNGASWLPPLLESLDRQTSPAAKVIVVDNGSTDGSVELLQEHWPSVEVISWTQNRGFAVAVNAGIATARTEYTALVNTDVVLDPDWLERCERVLGDQPRAGSVATKMIDLHDPSMIYDAGDFLRRDAATEQRGRFRRDEGRFDRPAEVWSACAGAAMYRTEAVRAVGGFEERLFIYLEDVELGLRLRQAGWTCRYEPCVARHAGGGSEANLSEGAIHWVERNTIAIVVRHFPFRWIGPVLYRQLAWAVHHARNGQLRPWLRGLAAGVRLAPAMIALRRRAPESRVPIDQAIPARPWRGRRAGGHRDSAE